MMKKNYGQAWRALRKAPQKWRIIGRRTQSAKATQKKRKKDKESVTENLRSNGPLVYKWNHEPHWDTQDMEIRDGRYQREKKKAKNSEAQMCEKSKMRSRKAWLDLGGSAGNIRK